jgi:hypothetical protein
MTHNEFGNSKQGGRSGEVQSRANGIPLSDFPMSRFVAGEWSGPAACNVPGVLELLLFSWEVEVGLFRPGGRGKLRIQIAQWSGSLRSAVSSGVLRLMLLGRARCRRRKHPQHHCKQKVVSKPHMTSIIPTARLGILGLSN